MLFNSLAFAAFFPTVFLLYLVLPHKWQNRMLLVASYVFYGWWDWRFLCLMLLSTAVDYICGLRIEASEQPSARRRYLVASVIANLLILGVFKYFDFFSESLATLLASVGVKASPLLLDVILPVGISFYTFQTMSYTIGIYRRRLHATRDLLAFALYVAFFPQLVAGPIERAEHLLPQILNPRRVGWNDFTRGLSLIFWGLFKKIAVADALSPHVDAVFSSSSPNGVAVVAATVAFAFQIYADFSGYSDIARGTARCMGFDIMLNFNLPYFVTNPRDFWRHWHISLSEWLRDYLYIPLGGSRKGRVRTYVNLILTMLLGGLWHGAAWTFAVWGLYQGALLAIHRALFGDGKSLRERGWLLAIPGVTGMFVLTCLGWLIFRAQSVEQIGVMLDAVVGNFKLTPEATGLIRSVGWAIWPLLGVQLSQLVSGNLRIMERQPWALRVVFYAVLLGLMLVSCSETDGGPFIYFQF